MKRHEDEGLGYLLRYENIAWYEDGAVRILDRRVYPQCIKSVVCNSYREVVQAISDMVTQSGGPYFAAGMGMALAAHECKNRAEAEQRAFMERASYELSHARPTTSKRMQLICGACFKVAERAWETGDPADQAIFNHTIAEQEAKYHRFGIIADNLVDCFPDDGTVLTQCFGETVVGKMCKRVQELGKNIKMACAETRPFFQGARLTASVAYDQGMDVTVLTDNMLAWYMNSKGVDVFTSASDVITCDGWVVNKVGTYQIALLCNHFGIPYYATGAPDKGHPTIKSVTIEMRDPNEALMSMGVRIAKKGVKGLYPAFDATPPEFITGIVTEKGIFEPRNVNSYFNKTEDMS